MLWPVICVACWAFDTLLMPITSRRSARRPNPTEAPLIDAEFLFRQSGPVQTIENVVRKLMQDGKCPLAVGLFFSLGHSLSIALAVAGIAPAAFALQGRFQEFKAVGSIIGTGASAFFLLAIAAINFVILRSVWHSFQRARQGENVGDHKPDRLLSGRGFLARMLQPLASLPEGAAARRPKYSSAWPLQACRIRSDEVIGFVQGLDNLDVDDDAFLG